MWNWNVVVVLVAMLIACAWKSWTKTSVCESNPDIWVVTPDSTGLRIDAAVYERYLGSQTALLSEAPPPRLLVASQQDRRDRQSLCLYLEVSPSNLPDVSVHKGWNQRPNNCRLAIMVNTDQFTKDVLHTPDLELILCKTRQCVKWVQRAQQDYIREDVARRRVPIVYTGFTSPSDHLARTKRTDSLDNLNRFDKFLHVAGKSPHKGTLNILQAWMQHPELPTLVTTSYNNAAMDAFYAKLQRHGLMPQGQQLPSNIRHIDRKLSKTELTRLMVSHGVHLCLSGMEGFGHSLNEARAMGALIVATDYPAMNELISNQDMGESSLNLRKCSPGQ